MKRVYVSHSSRSLTSGPPTAQGPKRLILWATRRPFLWLLSKCISLGLARSPTCMSGKISAASVSIVRGDLQCCLVQYLLWSLVGHTLSLHEPLVQPSHGHWVISSILLGFSFLAALFVKKKCLKPNQLHSYFLSSLSCDLDEHHKQKLLQSTFH